MMPYLNKKHYSGISFVTMCFNMGMEELSSVKGDTRSDYIEFYVKPLTRLCKAFGNMIVFADEECANYLKTNCDMQSLVIIPMEYSQLPRVNRTEEYLRAVHNMQIGRYERGGGIERIKRWLSLRAKSKGPTFKENVKTESQAKYTILNHSKMDLLDKAISDNPFESDLFIWIDAGHMQEKYSASWRNWNTEITAYTDKARFAFHMKRQSLLRLKCLRKTDILYCSVEDQIHANYFMVNAKNFPNVYNYYNEVIDRLLLANEITSEQGIFTLMVKKRSKMFDLIRTQQYDETVEAINNRTPMRL